MLHKLSKTIMAALAVVLVAAPMALAQQPGSTSGQQPGSTSGSNAPATHSPSMGTMGAENAIHATVADVNHQKHTVKLHMQDGQTVELKVPEQSLASLSKGDSVQVSINKTAGSSMTPSTNMPRTQPSAPGTTPGTSGSMAPGSSGTPAR
jgi:hypothetical protein